MPEARPPSVAPALPPAGPETAPRVPAGSPEGERVDPLAADVARAVRELRLAQGLSERGAARRLGTSQTQLRRMEDPRYLPSLRSLARLASAYGHQLRISFEDKDRPAPKAAPPRAPRPKAAARPATTRTRQRKRTAKARRRA